MADIEWKEVEHPVFAKAFWEAKQEHWTDAQDDISFERWFIGYHSGVPAVFAVHTDDHESGVIYDSQGESSRMASEIVVCSLEGWGDAELYWDSVSGDDMAPPIEMLVVQIRDACLAKLVADKTRNDAEEAE